ncbi:hypothetical protein P59_220 [Bacillus phage P59]|nr:hypothetical protein P59_220 [Bacillus phage P59]
MEMIKLEGYNNKTVLVTEGNLEDFLMGGDVEEFLSEYTHDDAEYIFDHHNGCKVLGYFIDQDDMQAGEMNGVTVFVAIDEGYHDRLTYYAPIGQHSEGDRRYLDGCIEISKEQYLKAAGPNGTPSDYL